MNLKDVEWDPVPTQPQVLRTVRAAVKSCVSSQDVAKLRTLLLSDTINGAIPHEIRGSVWLLLLGLRAEDLLAEDLNLFARSARNAVSDANSKEQIEKDVDRTRPGLQRFKQRTVRGALLRLLSLFCARRQVAYVQGFNELLAPFILLADTGGNPRIVYSLFNDFVSRFAPWMLDTSESRVFDVLKRAFKYFERLLLYHDPELYWVLENNMMTPDLYATSWFVTLFARNFTVECVMALWDLLLLSDNPLGIAFFGIALVTGRRNELLEIDPSRIPETLMMLTAKSPEEVCTLWHLGSEMQTINTPQSFQRLMTDRLLTQSGRQRTNTLSAARSMQASVCLQTTPDDLVAGEAFFSTWDCRTAAEYRSGHLVQAKYLPLDALRAWSARGGGEMTEGAKAELAQATSLSQQLERKSHVCLIGTGNREEDNADINILALHLTKVGIPYVSTLRGGFRVALAVAQSGSALTSVELSSFDEDAHKQARNVRLNAAALAAQQEYGQHHRLDGRPSNFADISGPESSSPVGGKGSGDTPGSTASAISTSSSGRDWGGLYTPNSIPSISAFADSEMSRALNRALTGIGVPGFSASEPSPSGASTEVSPADSSTSAGPFSPNALVSPVTPGIADLKRSSSSSTMDKNAGRHKNRNGVVSAENSPRLMESGILISPMPGVAPGFGVSPNPVLTETRSGRSSDNPETSPWGRDARPNWLSDASLAYPLERMPKGFTVNVMDDGVMAGLRLFPCRAKSERSTRMRGRNVEFRRRYVGVSVHYFLLLSPHATKTHLLEVKAIRYLRDIVRIAFKRARPELVTFEVRVAGPENGPNEHFVCIMPDGLRECVRLVKEYLAVVPPENDLDLEGTPDTTPTSTPRTEPNTDASNPVETPTRILDRADVAPIRQGTAPKEMYGKNRVAGLETREHGSHSDTPIERVRKGIDSRSATPTVASDKFFAVADPDVPPSAAMTSRNR